MSMEAFRSNIKKADEFDSLKSYILFLKDK
jgi:hypothetical protein